MLIASGAVTSPPRVIAALIWLAGATTLASRQASAEPNTNLARAASPASGYFGVEQPEPIARGAFHAGATFDAGRRLLVIRDPMTDEIVPGGELVASRLALHLAASLGVTERLELSGALSLAVQRGERAVDRPAVRGTALGRPAVRGTALGDVRLRAKLQLWRHRGLAVAGAVAVSLPTASSDAMFGDPSASLTPAVIAGFTAGRVELAAEAGYRVRGTSQFRDLSTGDELVGGLAARYRLAPRVWAQAELDGALGVSGRGSPGERPVEAIAGMRVRVDEHWLAQAGVGLGLGHGYGAPELRGLMMIGYAPAALPPAARVAWKPDETGDSVIDEIILDPPQAPSSEPAYRIIGDRIVLAASVLFELDRAEVQPGGRSVLAAIVNDWHQHPEWAEITVEGHADIRGHAGANQRLSEQRAEGVRGVLIELGIAPERLRAVGYGATRPIASGINEDAHARNRRVELVITRRRIEQRGDQ